jgi:hypothetical protein
VAKVVTLAACLRIGFRQLYSNERAAVQLINLLVQSFSLQQQLGQENLVLGKRVT